MSATSARVGKILEKFATLSARCGNVLSSISIFLIMLAIGVDIVGRFFFNRPLPGSTEIAASLMVFVVMLALAHAESTGQHISVTVVTGRFPYRVQNMLNGIACFLGICLFVPILWETWRAAWSSLMIREYLSGPLAVPFYPSKFAVPVGSGLLILQFLIKGIKNVQASLRSRGVEG